MHTLTTENAQVARTDDTPISGAQEDNVSMSDESVFDTRTVGENVLITTVVELFCGPQAMDFTDESLTLGTKIGVAYKLVCEQVPSLDEDRALYAEIETMTEQLSSGWLET
jgi:histidine ammonia-lyase